MSELRPPPPGVTLRRIDAAVEATRAGARSRSRDQNRELLVAELRAGGLMLPPPAVDVLLDRITRNSVHGHAAAAAAAGTLGLRVVRMVLGHEPVFRWEFPGVRLILPALPFQPIDVILGANADAYLAVGDADTIDVWLAELPAGDGTRQPVAHESHQAVAIFRGEYQVGALGPAGTAVWRPLVQESRDSGRIITTYATRQRGNDGQWELHIGLPQDRTATSSQSTQDWAEHPAVAQILAEELSVRRDPGASRARRSGSSRRYRSP